MLIKNYIKILNIVYSLVVISNNCYASSQINDEIKTEQNQVININENDKHTFVTVDSNSAPQPSNIPINQINTEYTNDLNTVKQENEKLKTTVELLRQELKQLQLNYAIEITSKKIRSDLKTIYQNPVQVPNSSFFKATKINNNSYEFKENITNILNCFKPNFPLQKSANYYNQVYYSNPNTNAFDTLISSLQGKNQEIENIYKNSDNICNWIYYQQQQFFASLDKKIKEMEQFEQYLNLLLDKLPAWDPKNTNIRQKIELLINNDCKPIRQQLVDYKLLQHSANVADNLTNIDAYIGKIKDEIKIIKYKITGDIINNNNNINEPQTYEQIPMYEIMNKSLYNYFNKLNTKYHDLLENDEFFKEVKDEIQYEKRLAEFMKKKH